MFEKHSMCCHDKNCIKAEIKPTCNRGTALTLYEPVTNIYIKSIASFPRLLGIGDLFISTGGDDSIAKLSYGLIYLRPSRAL